MNSKNIFNFYLEFYYIIYLLIDILLVHIINIMWNYLAVSYTHLDVYKRQGYELVALVHPDNEPSKNLLEKLNFESEGYAEKLDSIVYCLKSFKWLHGNKRKNNDDKFKFIR